MYLFSGWERNPAFHEGRLPRSGGHHSRGHSRQYDHCCRLVHRRHQTQLLSHLPQHHRLYQPLHLGRARYVEIKYSLTLICFHTCGVMFSCIRFSFNDFIIGERYFERLMVQGLEKISILVCCPFHHYKYMTEWNALKTEFFKQNLIDTSSWAKMKIKIQTDNIGKWHVAIIWFKIANFC